MKFLTQFAEHVSSLNRAIGKLISWSSLFLVILVFVIAVLRYAFKIGSIPMQELVLYLHGIIFMLGASYTLADEGHVRVDILYSKFSATKKAWINLLGTLFFLFPVCILIFYMSYGYVELSWRINESSSEAGGLPYLFLFKSMILILPSLLMLQGLAVVAQSISTLMRREAHND